MRVVAGRLGGRTLAAPPGDATRPTGARVKEALFSILADVSALRVLDLYAGSGALGIEALSRGATFAVFVESARPAQQCLRDNLAKLGLEKESLALSLRVTAARTQLTRLGPFDLVLCDPPWKDIAAARDELEQLAGAGLLAPGARIALEHSAKAPPAEPAGSRLVVVDQRRWGDTAVTFYEPAGVPAASDP
ncbi:MAG TPA: 16S rRNA (guanine(966)-N(2))-methyltransferase RsmD [Polyangiaceae bacterium]|nr:16S rRNA (guanine(966)-N(2))-methyltransferase RsmD [Polyangiaceae bacterium]